MATRSRWCSGGTAAEPGRRAGPLALGAAVEEPLGDADDAPLGCGRVFFPRLVGSVGEELPRVLVDEQDVVPGVLELQAAVAEDPFVELGDLQGRLELEALAGLAQVEALYGGVDEEQGDRGHEARDEQ